MTRLRKVVPAAEWLSTYSWQSLRGDLTAGLTVGVMLIPQAMAYAVLAGVSPIYGLYASVVPLLLYALLGTSRHLAVGTVALDMIIVAVGVGALAEPGTERYLELVVVLVVLVGALEIIMGLFRFGFAVILLSRPVIVGFTSAAALIIAGSQIGNLLGMALSRSENVFVLLWEALQHLDQIVPWSLALGGGGILLLLALQRWAPAVPAPLVAVVLGILAAWGVGMDRLGVEVVGAIPMGLPSPHVPDIDPGTLRELLPTALTLVLVQFMIVISLGKTFAARHRYDVDANRELIALGAANIGGALFRGVPVSGSFSRTAVNERSGAYTPLANAVAAGLVLLTLLLLTPLFAYLPIPVLAAIIIVAALGLFDLNELRFLLRTKRIDGYIALLTFGVTLFFGLQEGILIGVAASVLGILYRISRPNVAILGHLPGTRSFVDTARHPEARLIDGLLIVRVDASFSYVNADLLKDFLLEESKARNARAVIIDASTMNDLDLTAAAMLLTVAETLRRRGVELYFGGNKGKAYDVMARSGLLDTLGKDHFFRSPYRAARHILRGWGQDLSPALTRDASKGTG